MMIKLVVGLGNPGKEYEGTRHNVGFMVADKLAQKYGNAHWSNDTRFSASITKIIIDDKQVILAKSDTFMNNSGQSVVAIIDYYKIDPNDIIIIADDINLEVGSIRVRKSGSSGGHNGLKSIIDRIGEDFGRVRIGIGFNNNEPSESYVLKKIPSSDKDIVKKAIDKVVDYLVTSVSEGEIKEETLK